MIVNIKFNSKNICVTNSNFVFKWHTLGIPSTCKYADGSPLPTSSSCPSLPGSVMMLSFRSKESRLLRMSWLLVRSCTSSPVPVCIAMFGGMCPPDDTIEPSVIMTLTYIRKSFRISHILFNGIICIMIIYFCWFKQQIPFYYEK